MYVYVCDTTIHNSNEFIQVNYAYDLLLNLTNPERKISSGGTHAQSTSGPIYISRYRVLLKVVNHSWCWKMFVVSFLIRPPLLRGRK
jgi:hypothetical protein